MATNNNVFYSSNINSGFGNYKSPYYLPNLNNNNSSNINSGLGNYKGPSILLKPEYREQYENLKSDNKKSSDAVNGNTFKPKQCSVGNFNSETKTKIAPKAGPKNPIETIRKENGKISSGNVDKRVALTAAPKTSNFDESLFADKVKYVLGSSGIRYSWMLGDTKFYGLLRSALGTTSGLIFPYTPKVSFQHQVEYDTTSITHTNLSYNYYKNTPPPSVNLSAKFTADNRANALHMLSAIWFLTAASKCEFGENTNNPGLPPPILYLSGYDSTIDNIPVVIKSFNYEYPSDIHYVNLVLDMSKDIRKNEPFLKEYDYSTTIKEIVDLTPKTYDTPDGKITVQNLEPFPLYMSDDGGINLSFWLPTEMEISVSFGIQPNLIKHKKQWSNDRYKTGYLLTKRGKNPQVKLPTLDTKIISEDIKDTCGNILGTLVKEEGITENINFIPSGWTW